MSSRGEKTPKGKGGKRPGPRPPLMDPPSLDPPSLDPAVEGKTGETAGKDLASKAGKKKKTKPFKEKELKSQGLFMMNEDSDEDVAAGGSFLDMAGKSNRNKLGIKTPSSSGKRKVKKKAGKKDKVSVPTPPSDPRPPAKDNGKGDGEARPASKTQEDDAAGSKSALDAADDFSLDVKTPKSEAARALKPHESDSVYRSASSDDDDAHNVVPIDMHDLMSSMRKAPPPPGSIGLKDDDENDAPADTPSKIARKADKTDFYSSDDEKQVKVDATDKTEKKTKQKAAPKKLKFEDHIARAMKHHDDILARVARKAGKSDQLDAMLLLFAESCDGISETIKSALGVQSEAEEEDDEEWRPRKRKPKTLDEEMGELAGSYSKGVGPNGKYNRRKQPTVDRNDVDSDDDVDDMMDDLKSLSLLRKMEKDSRKQSRSPRGDTDDDGGMPRRLKRHFSDPGFQFHKFLLQPVPDKLGMVFFRVIGDHKQNELFVILDYEGDEEVSKHVMTAKMDKRLIGAKKKKCYTMRTDNHVLGRFEQIQTGKVLQYNIFGCDSLKTDSVFNKATRNQLGAVQITNTKDCPRHMTVLLPEMIINEGDEDEHPYEWKPLHPKEEILAQYGAGNFENLAFYENKKPHFDESLGAYTLDFDGRVTMASSKNYLLVSSHQLESIFCRFGRVDNSEFTMDVRYPLSPVQALGISLASIATKTTG